MAALAIASAALIAAPGGASAESLAKRLGPGVSVAKHDETSKVTFISTKAGKPIARPEGVRASTPPRAAARGFVDKVGKAFGVRDVRVSAVNRAAKGLASVRFQQLHDGVPVVGGEIIVNLDADNNVLSANGEASPNPAVGVDPETSADDARETALSSVAKEGEYTFADLRAATPELSVYDNRLLGGPGLDRPGLVWRTEVTSPGEPLRQLVLVDAEKGGVALSFNQIANARNRQVCDAAGTESKYPCTSPFARVEGQGPHPVADVNHAYDYAGDTYDFLATELGRDSLDDAGMPLVSTVRWCPADECPSYQNAFWDGAQMVYGTGFASADDVVGHEFQHGVTDFSSHLFYYAQSGAINESLSDVFGEFVDLTNGAGTDTAAVRWEMGEDIPGIGAIRDMQDPTLFGDPDRMQSPNYTADPNEQDAGGVHSNSGVNNKATYLITDGGTFNGRTVTGLGIPKTADIYYKANNDLLVSGSDYADLARSLRQACAILTGTGGITSANCVEVNDALLAVQMDESPANAPATDAPVCAAGQTQANVFNDNLENPASGNWTKIPTSGSRWYYPQNTHPYNFDATYATSGDTNMWGDDVDVTSNTSIAKATGVTIPAGTTYLRFNHAHGFEDGFENYDGGIVEYSTNNGATWTQVPQALFTHNGYSGTLSSGNPLGSRPAFVAESNGYISSRVNLSSLAGQSVRFGFRLGTDSSIGDYGWFIDDVSVYRCLGDTTKPVAKVPVQRLPLGATLGTNVTGASIPERITWAAGTDNITPSNQLTYRVAESVNGAAFTFITGWTPALAIPRTLTPGNTYRYQVYAKDQAGNISNPMTGPLFKPLVRQENASSVTYTGSWLPRLAQSTAYGGFVRPTTTVNALATSNFTSARNVAVVMPKASTLGTAQVCLFQGATQIVCKTIDLSPASGLGPRRVVFARDELNPSLGYSVRVQNLGGRIELDAIVIND